MLNLKSTLTTRLEIPSWMLLCGCAAMLAVGFLIGRHPTPIFHGSGMTQYMFYDGKLYELTARGGGAPRMILDASHPAAASH
jgi:hypothetical protein